jgi:hypothetical protein
MLSWFSVSLFTSLITRLASQELFLPITLGSTYTMKIKRQGVVALLFTIVNANTVGSDDPNDVVQTIIAKAEAGMYEMFSDAHSESR